MHDDDDTRTVQPFRPHHRALVVETCALACLAVFVVAIATMLPTQMAAVCTLLAGAAIASSVFLLTGNTQLYLPLIGWALALPGWLLYARWSRQPWAGRVLLPLAAAGAVLTVWTLAAYSRHLAGRHAAGLDAEARALRAQLARWERLLERCGFPGIRATGQDENRQGREVVLRLPVDGRFTIRALQNAADTVAMATRLPSGAVQFLEGRHAGEVIMHLDEADVLGQDVPFPQWTGGLTVTRPLNVGLLPDGRPAGILFRETGGVLVTGVTGAGKTNLLNVLITQLTQCTDVVVFAIDLKGGRLVAPWLVPWIEDRCQRPALDWVATDREEAEIMLRCVDEVITARSASLAGGSKVQPTREMPQLVVICDEMADLFGLVSRARQGDGTSNAALAEIGSAITRKARSEAVMPVWGTQKGTADFTGSSAIKSQSRLRFSLGVAQESDAMAVVDSPIAARLLAQARHPGSVLVTLPGKVQPVLVKAYRLDIENAADARRLDEFAEAAGRTLASPDPLALAVMGDRYAKRWERSSLFRLLRDQRAAAGPPPAPAAPAIGGTRTTTVPEVAQEFRAIMEGSGLETGPADPRARMYALLAGVPFAGLSVAEIALRLDRDGMTVTRQTIHGWLRDDIDQGLVIRMGQPRSAYARYKLRQDGGQP
jgi:hypothetical protein